MEETRENEGKRKGQIKEGTKEERQNRTKVTKMKEKINKNRRKRSIREK
jgi:hypothetical protein